MMDSWELLVTVLRQRIESLVNKLQDDTISSASALEARTKISAYDDVLCVISNGFQNETKESRYCRCTDFFLSPPDDCPTCEGTGVVKKDKTKQSE